MEPLHEALRLIERQAELENAMRQRRELASEIREEAFRRVDADAAFAPRRFLRLISRERTGVS